MRRVGIITRKITNSNYKESYSAISNNWLNFFNNLKIEPILITEKITKPINYFKTLNCSCLFLLNGEDTKLKVKNGKFISGSDRDFVEFKLLKHCLKKKFPILGICRGHQFINDPKTDYAGAGWILAENWFPYQRPTFVTPNFSGYISGHSTYSRAAAEVLTLLTGNPFFPGGLGEFIAKKNQFLVFEKGPTQDVKIQWATYRDASNQCSLSRIWGGIHPPVDDLPGRVIGEKVGIQAYNYGKKYFSN